MDGWKTKKKHLETWAAITGLVFSILWIKSLWLCLNLPRFPRFFNPMKKVKSVLPLNRVEPTYINSNGIQEGMQRYMQSINTISFHISMDST